MRFELRRWVVHHRIVTVPLPIQPYHRFLALRRARYTPQIGVRPCGTHNTPSAHSKSTSRHPARSEAQKNDRDALTYSERVGAQGSAHGRVMQITLYNHHDRVVMVQQHAESRQRRTKATDSNHKTV